MKLALCLAVALSAATVEARRPVKEYVINLDLPPAQRWDLVIDGPLHQLAN
jgi:hypothetical protein